MFRRVFVQTQIKPAAGFWGLERWKEKASWGLFHLAGAKPRHTGQSILGVWQRTHVGWQMTKMCGLVTVRPPPTPTPPPSQTPTLMVNRAEVWECWRRSAVWLNQQRDRVGRRSKKIATWRIQRVVFSVCAALLAPSEGLTVGTCSNVTYSHAKRPKSVVKEKQQSVPQCLRTCFLVTRCSPEDHPELKSSKLLNSCPVCHCLQTLLAACERQSLY